MEILRAETNEFPHLKNTNNNKNNSSSPSSSSSSTIDEDEDDDRLSNEDKSKIVVDENSTNDCIHQRERLANELKDYEDRWLAHRNFLLYTQAFSLKPEDRERLFSQMNSLNHDERDRFLAATTIYNQQPTNPYHFPSYPWSVPPVVPTTDQSQAQAQPPPPPPLPKSPNSDDDDSGNQSNSGSTTEWTFEEQFRQLYELSDEPKRKEFLDDLFAFMQKRSTPVNRIPIMAKHVLDLYELFRLVVSKGGLVEVINKKLWREVTKGLNLPSSITSAAFTLRTQYMKYLYPYECEKLQLSSPGELQAAIEGNRREGRRPSYAFEYSSSPQIMPPPPPPHPPPVSSSSSSAAAANTFLSSPLTHRSYPNHGHEAMQHAAMAAAAALSHPFFLAAAAASSRDVNHDQSSSFRLSSFDEHHHLHHNKLFERSATKRPLSPTSFFSKQTLDDSPMKKPVQLRSTCFTPVTPNTSNLLSSVSKLKIIAKENNPEKSITISIEINGINYEGTLYAKASKD